MEEEEEEEEEVFLTGVIPPKTSAFSFNQINNTKVKGTLKLYLLNRNFVSPLSQPGSCGEDKQTSFVCR